MRYVKCQNIFVNVLVYLLESLSFRLWCPGFLSSKLCFIIKISAICGAGQDTRNLCHKFNSQGPSSRVLGVRVLCPRVPESYGLRVLVLGPRIPGLRSHDSGPQSSWPQGFGSQGLESQVLILDYVVNFVLMKHLIKQMKMFLFHQMISVHA